MLDSRFRGNDIMNHDAFALSSCWIRAFAGMTEGGFTGLKCHQYSRFSVGLGSFIP